MSDQREMAQPLTPATALIAELVRRYWVLGMECSPVEIQELAWFLARAIKRRSADNSPLGLQFECNKFGPYTPQMNHLLASLDRFYLRSDKHIADADPFDAIWFNDESKELVQAFLQSEGSAYRTALEETSALVAGFESPFGMELLATVDWLISREGVAATVPAVREGMAHWPVAGAAERKARLFDDRAIGIALERLTNPPQPMAIPA